MGLNIGLYLRRSEGPIRKSKVLVRKSDVLVRTSNQEETKGICLCKQETRVNACGGLFQSHYYTPQCSTKTEADPS